MYERLLLGYFFFNEIFEHTQNRAARGILLILDPVPTVDKILPHLYPLFHFCVLFYFSFVIYFFIIFLNVISIQVS